MTWPQLSAQQRKRWCVRFSSFKTEGLIDISDGHIHILNLEKLRLMPN